MPNFAHPIRRLLIHGIAIMSATCALVLPADADPIPSPGGEVILPVTGLSIDLPPAAPGCSYRLSGSWALEDNGSFDGRDVVDEACADSLVAGTWISLGYFDAGADSAVVAAVTMTSDWATETDLWGAHWRVRGGIFDLGELGPTPSIVMCAPMGGGMSVLLQHFFLHQEPTMTQAAMLDGAARSTVLRSAWNACAQGHSAPAFPARHDEIRNRGDTPASRIVELPLTGFSLTIPDDGFVWIVRQDAAATSDFLDRMAPSLPDVSLEVAFAPGMDGATAFASLEAEKHDVAPENLPEGWEPGPQLVTGDRLELTASYETPGGVVILGIFQAPNVTDVTCLAPIIDALSTAAIAKELDAGDK